MKKLLALLLAFVMILPILAGCNSSEGNTDGDDEIVLNLGAVDAGYNTIVAGDITTALGVVGGGEVGYDVYAGVAGKDYTDEKYYTYNDYIGGTTDMKWSTHTWETNEDSAILDFITAGFYTFALNSTADGWSIVCEMAAALPVDVTADYIGKYGLEEGDKLQAWKIALNPNATWENGVKINADTYIYSYMELLDPLMKNRRADSLYAGDFVIYNAKEYFYQGQTVKTDNDTAKKFAFADLVKGADGKYTTADGEPVYVLVGAASDYLGGYSLKTYVDSYGAQYFDTSKWQVLVDAADEKGYAPLTDATWEALTTTITGNKAWGETDGSTLPSYLAFDYTYGECKWENVGIVKTGEYELVMITTLPTENPNYYVPYNLSSTYLVYQPMWEAAKKYFDADGNQVAAGAANVASITTDYCTKVENTMSYGPYKLTYFELDKRYDMERNTAWYGYSDGKHLGQYQTDKITATVIKEHATALMTFEAGDLEGVGLQAEDMEKYGSSNFLMYTPESYTSKLTFNTNLDSLMEHGSQVLYSKNFRTAFSLAIDRATFCSSFTSGHLPGFGLLNNMYVYDPFTGASYRDTDGAKKAIVDLYGLTYGAGGDYATLDEAYDAVTGYDMTTAKALMAKAYDECIASGLWDGKTAITLDIRVYNSDEIYVKMFNFLNDALKAACVGTGFEGKVELKMTADEDYYNTMYSGGTDIIFSTWGGAAYSPYTMLDQVYCDDAFGGGNQMEYGFETEKLMVTIKVDGHDVTTSLKNWAAWAGNKEITIQSDDKAITLEAFGAYDAATRSNFFAMLENAYLQFCATTPMYYRNSVSVRSQNVNYPVDAYVDLIGYGGLQFITYNYDDAGWDAVKGTMQY